jgi:outer membrane protein assembly factor BamB
MGTSFKHEQSGPTSSGRLVLIVAGIMIALLMGSFTVIYYLTPPGQRSPGIHATPVSDQTPTGSTSAETDQVYAVVNNTIYRYNPATHALLWSVPMALPSHAENIGPRAQVVGNLLYTLGPASDGYYSYAFNIASGSLRWRFKVPYQTSDLTLSGDQVVSNGRVYLSEVASFQGYTILLALDASTGTILWQHRYDGTGIMNPGHPVDDSAGIYLQAASSTTLYGTTFTGTGSNVVTTLYAIDAGKGTLLWRRQISTNGHMPDLVGGLVVDGVLSFTASPTLYGFDAATGAAKWSVALDGRVYDSFTALNGILYVATTHDQLRPDHSVYESSGSLYAVRAQDGAHLWRYHPQAGVFSPLAQNGLVFVTVSRMDGTTPQGVVALDITSGTIRWTRPLPAVSNAGRAQIAIGNGNIYVNNSDGQIQVWQSSNGTSVTTLTIPVPASDSLDTVAVLTVVPWSGQ